MQGFYKMEYTGNAGQGVGSLAFVNGYIAGVDVAGGVYEGQYQTLPDGVVTGYADLSFPKGGMLVTGVVVAASAPPMRISFSIEEDGAVGQVIRIQTPTGPVNLRLTKLSALGALPK
ncbi:hypothetical protein [Agrobacterium cavarae]|uniref:hypothetical protein n=1 Tax=Agrobacterium cavarae TaxID=2528239 RepID=UPI000DD3BDB6